MTKATVPPRRSAPPSQAPDIVRKAVTATRHAFVAAGLFSCVVNILMLTGPLFMLQIYDRVLTSGSVPTLVALTILVVVLYFFMGLIDIARNRVLTRIGHRLEEEVGQSAFLAQVSAPVRSGPSAVASEPVRDIDRVRQFFSTSGITALFDLPWLPVYVAIVFLIHPWLGYLAAAGALLLFVIALVTDFFSRPAIKKSGELSLQRNAIVGSGRRNAEVLHSMGMLQSIGSSWDAVNERFLAANARVSDVVGLSAVISKVFRLFLQSAVLALGAYLAIQQVISPGAMIAASIIMARGLQPVELAVSNWRQMLTTQAAWRRLRAALAQAPQGERVSLPAPRKEVVAQQVTVIPPGATAPTLRDVSFSMPSGSALGIVGHSGSGKSTLVRALVGVWPTAFGRVTLDGAPLDQWPPEQLGRHIGYLPQDVELFEGTIAANISRFDPDAADDAIIAAARAAGCHEMILTLKDGYNTQIGEQGAILSAGQRQRVALARALYRDPFFIVLDEPNSNLDSGGESALNAAIVSAKARGAIVVVVAHRASAIAQTDKLAVIDNGRLIDFGDRQEVIEKRMRRQKTDQPQPAPMYPPARVVVSDREGEAAKVTPS